MVLWEAPADAQVPDVAAPAEGVETTDAGEDAAGEGAAAGGEDEATATAPSGEVPEDAAKSVARAKRTVLELMWGLWSLLPRLGIAIVLVALAALLARAIHWVLRRTLRGWERSAAIAALVRIVILLIAVGAGLSIIAGDARALVGSVGLAGLALSWALQTPIESFTGWLMNSFRGYYRVGDRIEVGDVFGDVYKIDILTTTVWEAGGPGKPVGGAQPTGALITFPNWEVLRSNIVNYSRDFPYVWDEIGVSVGNASDMHYARALLERVAIGVFGQSMSGAATTYRILLQRARLAFDVADRPEVFVAFEESWTTFTIRYLVDVRQRRRWASELTLAVQTELNKPEHAGKVLNGAPVRIINTREGERPI